MKTFTAGVHLEYRKEATQRKPIVEAALPKKVIIPLHQHTGACCEPLVKVGDEVYEGQKIGDSSKFISAPVHASISGKVTKIDKMLHPCGVDILSVVIEAQTTNHRPQTLDRKNLDELTSDEIRRVVREAGIVGLGGAAFPTHVKLTPPEGKKIDTVIINGCECEPYITADHRIMLERAEDIIYGARAIAKAVGASKIIVGIEDNKLDAVDRIKFQILNSKFQTNSKFQIQILKTKYPQGGEKQLIKSILNREVPSGGLPLDIGVVVSNVGTAVAVAEAIRFGTPLIKRTVTVTGSGVRDPQNLLVRIGTTFEEIITQCGGLTEDAARVVMGGPMMGVPEVSLEIPVVKATSAILVLTKSEVVEEKVYPCIKCAKCVDHCPMYLVPTRLASLAEHELFAEFEDWGGQDCIECGCCSYVCPSKIPLVHWIKFAKLKLRQMK